MKPRATVTFLSIVRPLLPPCVLLAATVSLSTQALRATPTVYRLNATTGIMYHLASCPNRITGFRAISLVEAIDQRLGPCPECLPNKDPQVSWGLDHLGELRERDRAAAARLKAEDDKRTDAALAAPLVPISEAQARRMAADVEAAAKNDPDAFRTMFRRKIRDLMPVADYSGNGPSDFEGPFFLHNSSELVIGILGPIAKFELAFAERIRQFTTTAGIVWDQTVTVTVAPKQIDAPSIQRIVLQRNGAVVPPLTNTLRLTTLTTRMGAKDLIYQGEVTYPAAVFAPAVNVDLKLTAVPVIGDNIVKTFRNRELRTIR
jgi:hypothetical protein